MALTSFKHFLNQEKPKSSDFIRFLQLLLQGISLHAIEGEAGGVTKFRTKIDEAAKLLIEQSSSEEVLGVVSNVIQALQNHSQGTSSYIKAYTSEMQAMLAMMSSTIAFLATSSKAGVTELQSIERNLEIAAGIDDVKSSRAKLSECLVALQNESVRIHKDSEERIKVLRKGLERSANKLPTPLPLTDPATGLQGRGKAEETIARRILDGKEAMVALFLVDRLASLNSRYGRKVGDDVLLMVALYLTQNLPETSPPFRWSGPAFVVLIDLTGPSPVTERKIKQIAAEKLEKYVEAEGRNLMMPISCTVVIQKISGVDSPDAVFRALDKFIAAHGGEVTPVL